jgi:hypothetical protein
VEREEVIICALDRRLRKRGGLFMGCDIHFYVERKVNGVWEAVPDEHGPIHPYYSENNQNEALNINCWTVARNYSLFGILAGIRSNIEPINDPKGMPGDVSPFVKEEHLKWGNSAHTPSFFTLQELLNVKDEDYSIYLEVDPVNYKRFLNGEKEDLIGYYSRDMELISNEEMNRLIKLSPFFGADRYVTEIKFSQKYSSIGGHFWNRIIPAMQKLDSDPSNVRMVFWFDN